MRKDNNFEEKKSKKMKENEVLFVDAGVFFFVLLEE